MNNTPAFPMIRDMRYNPDWDHEEGMTLRDYFAAKAMQAYLNTVHAEKVTVHTLAECSYDMADAMLLKRHQK